MSTARRKGDARQLKGNVATKKRSKSDTNNGSPQKGNAAKKKRGKSGAGHKTAGKGTANTDTGDDAGDEDEERRGKSDAWDEAEYDDKDDFLPVTDAPFGVRQRDARRLAEFNTATVVLVHWLEFMQRGLFHLNQPMLGRQKPRVLPLRLLKLAGLRVRLTTLCIS